MNADRRTREVGKLAECYADLSDSARRLGRRAAADRYLLLAWAAFEEVEVRPLEFEADKDRPSADIVPFPTSRE